MYKLVLALAALQVLLAATDCLTLKKLSRSETVTDTGTHIEVCTQAPIDLGIVLDSSSSIYILDFKKAITFLQEFLDYFDVGSGREGVRVSIITYGKGIYPQDGFNLTTYSTKADLLEAIGKIPHHSGNYTDTGKAIKYMHEVQLADNVVRPGAKKISIVITDGNSQLSKVTQKAAEAARNAGITMFAVGVGKNVKDQELLNIAGDPSRVTKVESFDQLDSIKDTLASKTCIKKEKPTTTQEPKTQCGERYPSDIYFAFSSAGLGVNGTAWTTAFISYVINAEDLSVGFRYGVVSGSYPDNAGFDIDTYSTMEEYKGRLGQYDRNPLPQVIQRLLGNAYSAESGGRAEASKVAVIVVSGDSKEAEELSSLVDQLIKNGVKVFIADPSDTGLRIEGALTLNGRSSRSQAEALVTFLCSNLPLAVCHDCWVCIETCDAVSMTTGKDN